MFDIIVACTSNFGIGFRGRLPWNCPQELALFKQKTIGCVLIMGRKTVETLPMLKDRNIICVSRNKNLNTKKFRNNCLVVTSIEKALELAKDTYPEKKVFVAGGSQIYQECLTHHIDSIERLHISFIKLPQVVCDVYLTFFNHNDWVTEDETHGDNFTHHVMKYCPKNESQYINLLLDVCRNGELRQTRNGKTWSSFCKHLSFDLQDGFPLLTTKKMFTRGIIEELLFFLRGETDSKILEEKNVNIWKHNTDRKFLDSLGMTNRREGVMGQMYGYNWRYFGAKYDEEKACPTESGIDQLKNVLNTLKNNPASRRIIMTSLNPTQLSSCVLPPCHSVILQFYVSVINSQKYLSMFCYIRSSDMFLGLPFNIASSAFLLSIIAKACDMVPKNLNITLGDAHIYEQHIDAVKKQVQRQPYMFPTLEISKNISTVEDIEKLQVTDFVISRYKHHPKIKADMVA